MLLVVMLVSAGGMVFSLSKQKSGAEWGKPLAIVFALIALVCAIMNITKGGSASTQNLIKNELAYQQIQGEKLGIYLAKKYPDSNVLLLLDPAKKNSTQPDSIVEGLKKGLGTLPVKEVYPTIPESDIREYMGDMPPDEMAMEDMLPPTEIWLKPAAFQDLIFKDGKGCDLVITTIGLPENPQPMTKLWSAIKADKLKLAIAVGGVYDLQKAISAGMICAAVSYNPEAPFENKRPPKDLDEAFDKRYLLITPDNLDQITSDHPKLFR